MTNVDTHPVTVLGLGEMGSALARAFLSGGHPVTVWNRTRARAEPLIAEGAGGAESVRDAVAASPLVVVNVQGNAVAKDVLEQAGDALAGRDVLNLTDGTSAEASAVAEWVAERGARYLHGQLMTIAPGVGHPDATVFYGGSREVHDRYRGALDLLGGKGVLVSADAGVPTLYGMAVHGTMWGALNGFLHAAALLTKEGVDLTSFLGDAGPAMSSVLSLLPSLAAEVDSGEYAIEFGGLRHHLPSVVDLMRESEDRGVAGGVPALTLDLVRTAVADGHGDDSYSRLIEYFRA
ncbi:NAD(P)-dependent oxidoreductase [Prauserella cavernicola]|uniref:NAD(P)-dependent oxidoreductase n=1 Tax=Prauserella cavernicola TaxID=2800127 RepID=A0A934V2L8_9PSEU|nr:NAD(P)-binding domain-containing protein [Prauserella cavernicola]MBK1786071.1 NAD(P)-dependent oxidoreductase [Prauserella cavernicola]